MIGQGVLFSTALIDNESCSPVVETNTKISTSSDDKSVQQDEEEEAPHPENKLEHDITSSPTITKVPMPQHNQQEPIMIEDGDITSKHSLNDNMLQKKSCTTSSQVPSVDERGTVKMSQSVDEPFNQWATGVVFSGLAPNPPIMYHTVTPFGDWAKGVVFSGINIETEKQTDANQQSESNVMLDASERSEKSVDFSEVVTTRVSANKRENKTVCFRGHDSYIQNKQRRRSSTSIDVSVDMDTLLMNEVGEGTSTPKEICNNVNMMGIMNQCTGDLAFNVII